MPLAPQDVRTFFVTTVTAQRGRLFQVERTAELFLNVIEQNRAKGRLSVHAFVLMPDHIHLILTPAPEVSLEKAMQYLKGGFSFQVKSNFDVWEKSFMEHRIKDSRDLEHHRRYVEENPVRARIVVLAAEYRYSSASRVGAIDPVPEHLQG
jgi:putative transposase